MSPLQMIKVAAVGIALLLPGVASAGTILGATGVTANVATYPGGSLSPVINQTGLASGYTSGVTDFQTYLDGSPAHDSLELSNVWLAASGITAAQVIFDLGADRWIDKLALWNRGLSGQGVKDFTLSECDDAACASASSLGSYTATAVVGSSTATAVLPEAFSFAATSTRYVAMNILNTYNPVGLSFGEIAFEQVSAPVNEVPEPASLALLAVGAIGAGLIRRRTAS